MPILPFLKNIFSGGASELVKTISNTVDEFNLSGEEKEKFKIEILSATNSHLEKMAALSQSELEAYLKDTQSARDANAKIQESDKASWLAKNVAYMIDLFLAALWGTVTIILFLKVFKIAAAEVDMISLMALHGTVTAVFMTVVNFHRGTSKGSEDKQRQLNQMMEK